MTKVKFEFKKVANLIMVVDESGQVWKAWDECEFTVRKMNNYMNRIRKNYKNEVEFIKTF